MRGGFETNYYWASWKPLLCQCRHQCSWYNMLSYPQTLTWLGQYEELRLTGDHTIQKDWIKGAIRAGTISIDDNALFEAFDRTCADLPYFFKRLGYHSVSLFVKTAWLLPNTITVLEDANSRQSTHSSHLWYALFFYVVDINFSVLAKNVHTS